MAWRRSVEGVCVRSAVLRLVAVCELDCVGWTLWRVGMEAFVALLESRAFFTL